MLIGAATFLVVVLAVVIMLPLFQDQKSESVNASYEFLREGKDSPPSLLPDELTAAIVFDRGNWVANGPVSPSQVEAFVKSHKKVETLKFRSSEIDWQGLKALQKCDLTDLRIASNPLGEKELTVISGIISLNRLSLEDNQLNGGDLTKLKGPASLYALIVRKNKVNETDIESIVEQYKKLGRLDLSKTDVQTAWLEKLKKLKKLRELILLDCVHVSSTQVKRLKTRLPNVKVETGPWSMRSR